jgi:hypothetical protein
LQARDGLMISRNSEKEKGNFGYETAGTPMA